MDCLLAAAAVLPTARDKGVRLERQFAAER